MKKILLLLILAISTTFVFSQTNKRISILNPTVNVLKSLSDSGIDLSCGANYNNNNLILELSSGEIDLLDLNGISYSVLIDDLTKYTIERSKKFLPIAKKELEDLKLKSKANKDKIAQSNSKSLSFDSVTIDNILQYDGCEEIDWGANVPSNFNLGTMAGCLTYSEMLAELDQMRALYPNLITIKTDASPGTVTHGNSYNTQGQDTWAGQPVYYVKISDNPDTDESEPEALYTGMTHSREVSSMMNLMYFMWYILENYSTDSGVKNLVDNRELYFIPVVNPDGLMWNQQQNPSGGGMQRKNLNPAENTGNHVLRGVDLNRNYDYFWGPSYSGSSNNNATNTYRGTDGFSEPETQIIRNFVLGKNFKTAILHHANTNNLLHGYAGDPSAAPSGREDEFAKFCHDMSRYNRYIYGTVPDILTLGNGGTIDWMLGGPADNNNETGSGKGILAITPENGSWQGTSEGFWPTPTKITEIAQRALRMNFVNGFIAGKFAQLHDFTATDINSLSGNLDFGIEFIGQTLGDFTLTVTPISTNIVSITSPSTEVGMTKLEQRSVSASYSLNASIQPNDLIEYQVTLSNEDNTIYQANIIKYYQPSVVFQDNPDVDAITNWTTSGGTWGTTTGGFNGTTGITDSPTGSYGNNQSKTIKLNQTFDLTSLEKVVVQFNAKWAIERNFDYVQLQARVNGGSWSGLCGKYTKPGSDYDGNRYTSSGSSNTSTGKIFSDQNNQPSGEMVYEGHGMDKWVMEEVYIDISNNTALYNKSNVDFRFIFDSDSNNRADGYGANFDPFDGFTFDDFKIIGIQIPCDATNPPTGVSVASITSTTADVAWNAIPSATYDLRYREVGAPAWTTVTNIATVSYALTGLSTTTDYEVQVNARCTSATSAFSSSSTFTTLAVSYCASNGLDTNDEYIGNVTLGTINNNSTAGTTSTGYSDYTVSPTATQTTDLDIDAASHPVSVTKTWPASGGGPYDEAVSIWIDFNQDGDFADAGEQVFTSPSNQTTPVSGVITIPSIASGTVLGTTIMRVSMKYNAAPTGPCEEFNYGEVEDYTVNIFSSVLGVINQSTILNTLSIYPNPASDQIFINTPTSINLVGYKLSNTIGQEVLSDKFKNTNKIDVSVLNTGVYFLSINTDKGEVTKKIVIQ